MDHDTLEALRDRHPAWRLLRAQHAPMVLSFLGRHFVEDNNGDAAITRNLSIGGDLTISGNILGATFTSDLNITAGDHFYLGWDAALPSSSSPSNFTLRLRMSVRSSATRSGVRPRAIASAATSSR